MVDLFAAPTTADVSQFGADNSNVGRYKQAAEYAQDAQHWAEIAKNSTSNVDTLLEQLQDLFNRNDATMAEILTLKSDFEKQQQDMLDLKSKIDGTVGDVNNLMLTIDAKLVDINKALNAINSIHVTVTTLPSGSQATGTFDPSTGEIALGIPAGAAGTPGQDGSVTDLGSVTSKDPTAADLGFFVNITDNKVYKTTISKIAETFPSVTAITFNGGAKEQAVVDITKTKIGLGNVLNVASYSKTESDDKQKGYYKTYDTLAQANADLTNREIGEKVLVIEDTKLDFYTVALSGTNVTLHLDHSEPRVLTINHNTPDASGNIQLNFVSGNPSLYIGEMLMFPYDPNQEVAYSGILPADGSEIQRSNYTKLVDDLTDGKIPVVSETEWQAGAHTYFSWGKKADGTDGTATDGVTLRLPKWTDGTAIRSPDETADANYNGGVKAQIPYVATVNTHAPNNSGAIVLTADDVKALPMHGEIPDKTNLNTITGGDSGWYYTSVTGNATTALNYPVAKTGSLLVMVNKFQNNESCHQIYYAQDDNSPWVRHGTQAAGAANAAITWTPWEQAIMSTGGNVNGTLAVKNNVKITSRLAAAGNAAVDMLYLSATDELTVGAGNAQTVIQSKDVPTVTIGSTKGHRVFINNGDIPNATNLNIYDGTKDGFYFQNTPAAATTALNYPVAGKGGSLLVIQNGVTNSGSCTQIYQPSDDNASWIRTGTQAANAGSTPGAITWSRWVQNITSAGGSLIGNLDFANNEGIRGKVAAGTGTPFNLISVNTSDAISVGHVSHPIVINSNDVPDIKIGSATVQPMINYNTLGTVDLNSKNGNASGVYYQQTAATATIARHYPVAGVAGTLVVYQTNVDNNGSCVQTYYAADGSAIWIRTAHQAAGTSGTYTWSDWEQIVKETTEGGIHLTTTYKAPSTGDDLVGGEVNSDIIVDGKTVNWSTLRTQNKVGQKPAAHLIVNNYVSATNTETKEWIFGTDGIINCPGAIMTTGGAIRGDREVGSAGIKNAVGQSLQSRVLSTGSERCAWGMYAQVANDTVETRHGILSLSSDANTTKTWTYNMAGDAAADGGGNWVAGSDERIKKDIKRIENPLDKMKQLKGCTWTLNTESANAGIGFIAQDVQKVFPEVVNPMGNTTLTDGEVVKDTLAINAGNIAAGLHHEAILALMEQVESLKAEIADLKASK